MKIKFLFVIFTLIYAAPSFALDAPSVKEYCEAIHAQQAEIHRPGKWSLLKDALRLILVPGRMVHLQQTELAIPAAGRVQVQENAASENIIFSISPPNELTQSESIQKMRMRLQEIDAALKAMSPDFNYIIAASTVDDCVSRVEETQFDLDQFNHLVSERSSLHVIEQIDEATRADQIIAKTLRRLRLPWKVVHSTDLMEVHSALLNPEIKNVVLFSHGLSEGKLVDSRINEYPLSFFSDLSPSIRSLTIFACHGAEIAEAYHLSESLANNPSEYASRSLFISKGTQLEGMDELVPIRAFPSFMKKVDRILSWGEEGNATGPMIHDRLSCEVEVDRFKVKQGTFGFLLNGRYIGSLNQGNADSKTSFHFPCSYADRKVNILTIHGLSLLQTSDIESPHFEVVTHFPVGTVSHSELTHYFRADHTYQGSKYVFEVGNSL